MARKDTRGGGSTFRNSRGGMATKGVPRIKASGGRKKKGTNRKPGERGLSARGFQRSGGGSRNSAPAASSRSSGS